VAEAAAAEEEEAWQNGGERRGWAGQPPAGRNSEFLEKLKNSKTQKLDAARADNERTFVRVFALGVLEKLAKTPKTRENVGPVPGAGTPFAAA
jgi:hypothetical protein